MIRILFLAAAVVAGGLQDPPAGRAPKAEVPAPGRPAQAPPLPPPAPTMPPASPSPRLTPAPRSTGPVPAQTMPDLPAVVFDLDPGDDAPQRKPVPFELPGRIRELVGREGADWIPDPNLWTVVLTSQAPGDPRTLQLRAAGLTTPTPSPLEVEFDRRKVSRDNPARLVVIVPDPSKLRAKVGAGVFTGKMTFEIRHQDLPPGQPFYVSIPVEVRVRGHRLVSLQFSAREGNGPLRVGQPATVEVDVEAIGVGLGAGRLDLTWQAPGASAVPLVKVPLPLPGSAWDPSEVRKDWACHPAWLSEAIVAPAVESIDLPGLTPGLTRKRHRVRLVLPDWFALGSVSGAVTWSPGEGAKGEPGRLELPAPIPVASGFWASPRFAAVGETVEVYAVVGLRECPDAASWESLPIDRSAPGVPNSPSELEKVEVAGADHVLFKGDLQPGVAGAYTIAIAGTAEDSAKRALARPVVVRVPFQVRTNLPVGRRLVLFKGSPPLYWNFYYTAEDGADHHLRRSRAFELAPDGALLKEARLKRIGVFRNNDTTGKSRQAIDPAQDPRVRFATNETPEPAPNAPEEWTVAPGGLLQVDLLADVDQPPAGRSEHPNSSSDWLARWLITGVDVDGQPVARVVETPFSLEVTDEWSYYFTWDGAITLLIAVAILAVVACLAWLLVRGVVNRSTPTPTQPKPTGGGASEDDDLFGGAGSEGDAAAPAAARPEPVRPAKTKGKAKAKAPPDRPRPAPPDDDPSETTSRSAGPFGDSSSSSNSSSGSGSDPDNLFP